ncbi:hypothetical protein [Deinococcus kurensis]|uniref:hypothetical protein n=1 Tax=Deinococcus kurensis TaxID=2662757 RepID=UPI0012D3629D|nr:hypothetical protein [Deinococcus kurensis]
MPHSVTDQPADSYALIEKLEGPAGTAYRYNRTDPTEFGMSQDRWLINVPDLNERSLDDDEHPVTGVFVLEAIISGHEFWAAFKGVLSRFDHAYQLTLSEACEPDADASNPDSAYDLADPCQGDYGDDLATLPHLLRVWAEEIVAGRLHPYEGAVGHKTPAEWQPYYTSLLARAEAAQKGA